MLENFERRTAAVSAVGDVQGIWHVLGMTVVVSFVVIFAILYHPAHAKAGVLDEIRGFWQTKAEASASNGTSVQAMVLPKPAMNIDPNPDKGGGDVTIIDGEALVPDEGPSGTMADIVKPKNQQISIYIVQPGDSLSVIAAMFDVSVNTIKWANEIPPSGTIRVGQALTILPVTGVKYTVKKGDTFGSIAKKYDADVNEIQNFNGIEALAVGSEIIIPNAEVEPTVATKVVAQPSVSTVSSGYYGHPLPGARRTQGIHGTNGVDLAMPGGTPILASAAGEVIVAREGGYNLGYGSYVVIQHDNGTQTLYAHQSRVAVSIGQAVVKGQVIGYVGNTGKVTGAGGGYHLHFEIRGVNGVKPPRNPF
jgi:LysM repeat protein